VGDRVSGDTTVYRLAGHFGDLPDLGLFPITSEVSGYWSIGLKEFYSIYRV